MRKNFTILLILLSSFICLTTISVVSAQQSIHIEDEGVESLTLEQDSLIYCPYRMSESCVKRMPTLNISTVSKNAEKQSLSYYYFVTGGKIVGEGVNVVWDFTKEKPGKYSITVGIGKDSIIKGKTITKTIDFRYCYGCETCICPILNVLGPTYPIKAGDAAIITAEVKGGTQETVRYNWTLANIKTEVGQSTLTSTSATIEFGQSTKQIIVRTDKSMKGQKIIATVELGGVCATCSHVASIAIEIDDK